MQFHSLIGYLKNIWRRSLLRINEYFKPMLPPIEGAVLKGSTNDKCPACVQNLLNEYKIYGMNIEACPNCIGIWLVRDELRKLKNQVDKDSWGDLRWMNDEVEAIEKTVASLSNRICPKCAGKKLVSTKFGHSNIIIDYCANCHGTWLDRNEFQKIVDYLREELNHFTSEDMKQKVREEIKKIWTGTEGKLDEILDAKASISAFLMTSIFEHPTLMKLLMGVSSAIKTTGLGR